MSGRIQKTDLLADASDCIELYCEPFKIDKVKEKTKLTVENNLIEQNIFVKNVSVRLEGSLTYQKNEKSLLETTTSTIKTIYAIRTFLPERTKSSFSKSLLMCHLY